MDFLKLFFLFKDTWIGEIKMENNEIILIEDGKEVSYRILFSIEDVEGKNYVVYTNTLFKFNLLFTIFTPLFFNSTLYTI